MRSVPSAPNCKPSGSSPPPAPRMRLSPQPQDRARSPLPAGETTRLHSPQSLALDLADWGRGVIRSGAQEAQHTATRLTAAEASLRDALEEAGVASPETAQEAVAARKELDAQIKAANATPRSI